MMSINEFREYYLYTTPLLAALFLVLWLRAKARLFAVERERDRSYESARGINERLMDAEEGKRRAERSYEALLNGPLQVCPRAACGAETKLVTICPVCQVEGCIERCVPRGGPCVQCAREGATLDDGDPLDDLESGTGPGPGESTPRKGHKRSQF